MRQFLALSFLAAMAAAGLAQDPAKAAQDAARKAAEESAKKAAAAAKAAGDVQDAGMEMPKPGPEHDRMKAWAGEFSYVNKYIMGPGQTMESKGMSTSKVEFNGFHLVSEDRGEVMGMSFVGRMTLGFDPAKKRYVGAWVDSFGPDLMVCEGSYDDQTKTLTLIGEMNGMATGKKEKTRMVTNYKDANAPVFNMYQPGPDGKETMFMEITYTRKK